MIEIPEGAKPFIHHGIWSPSDPADMPTDVKPKKLSLLKVNNRQYIITTYGCVVYAMEPTPWGEMGLQEQPPLRFLGRHQWKIVGAELDTDSGGIKDALAEFPSSVDAPERWEGLMEFRIFSSTEGYPVLKATENSVYIHVEYGKYLGAVSPPPAPHDRLFYKTVLAGYWMPKGAR
ncbi:MAG: hypothetical protein H6727_09345 [Myxococcales bacterium]|nr:hypothetical protein [Myxococcales bacterium]